MGEEAAAETLGKGEHGVQHPASVLPDKVQVAAPHNQPEGVRRHRRVSPQDDRGCGLAPRLGDAAECVQIVQKLCGGSLIHGTFRAKNADGGVSLQSPGVAHGISSDKISMWFLCIRSVKETLQISGSLRHYRAIPMVQLRSRDFSSDNTKIRRL